MIEILESLADLSGRYDAVFCDLWGCLHNGKVAFPAAVAALQGFRANGGRVVLLTNAPRPSSSVIKQLDALGAPRDCWDIVVTSGDAAQMGMLSGAVGRRVHHIGAPKDEPFFTDFAEDLAAYAKTQAPITRVALKEAEGIVCTGLNDDLTETPDDYRAALLLGKTLGLPMLCANPDIVVDMGDKRLYCAGALAQLSIRKWAAPRFISASRIPRSTTLPAVGCPRSLVIPTRRSFASATGFPPIFKAVYPRDWTHFSSPAGLRPTGLAPMSRLRNRPFSTTGSRPANFRQPLPWVGCAEISR
jgi:HAD superfamily hydrolase (TIGR01459 family)